MTLRALNALDREGFVEATGWIFEHSPWVAERAWSARPFPTIQSLHAAMTNVVNAADREDQLALIKSHPDLGAKVKMSEASVGEQAGAGLDSCTAEEFERLQQLNTSYKDRFGFPFIFAVKGSTRHDILGDLASRLRSDPETEQRTALQQIGRIAWFRLSSAIDSEETA